MGPWPSVRCCCLVPVNRNFANISFAATGRILCTFVNEQIHLLEPDGRFRIVDLEDVDTNWRSLKSATISNAGDTLFFATKTGISKAFLNPSGEVGPVTLLVPDVPEARWPFNALFVAGAHLYYWRDDTTFMHMDLGSGEAEVAASLRVDFSTSASWALHVPADAAGAEGAEGVLYLKRDSDPALAVHAIHLGTATHTTVNVPPQYGHTFLKACTGDGKLVIRAVDSDGDESLLLWDPAHPHDLPQLLAGGLVTGIKPWDVPVGEQAAFNLITGVAIGPAGQLCVHDFMGDESSISRLVCVGTTLVPPAHLAPPPAPDTAGSSSAWEVVGSAGDLLAAQGQLLASGERADVIIRVGRGVVLKAHSFVLWVHSEWFRARLGRWEPGSCDGAGSSTSHAVIEIDAQEVPPAVMRALLQFVYIRRVVLGREEQGEQETAAAASPQKPAAKKARTAEEGTAGCSTSQQQTGAGTGAGAGAGAAAGDEDQMQPHVLLVHLLHAAQIYGVALLRAACLDAARARISVHSALPWLAYAHEQGEQELKQLALGWAAQHYTDIQSSAPETLDIMDDLPGRVMRELIDAVAAAGVQPPSQGGVGGSGRKRGRA